MLCSLRCRLVTTSLLLAITYAAAQSSRAKRVSPVSVSEVAQFNEADSVGVAVLVGVGKYPPFSGLGQLHFPGSDVDAIAAVMKSQRYSVLTLKDSDATKQSVLNAISQTGDAIAREVKDGKRLTVVFFFSGHGFAVDGKNYLATFDAGVKNLGASGLAVEEVDEALVKTKAARRVLWIDACRNEPGKGVESRSLATLQASAGTRALLSTEAGKISYEDDELKQGVFTYYLVKGLRGGAAKSDGLITFEDLAAYVESGVQQRSLSSGHVQVPYEAGEHSGDFLIAGANRTVQVEPQPIEKPADLEPSNLQDLQSDFDRYKRRVNVEKSLWESRKPALGHFRPEIQVALDGLEDNLRQAAAALSKHDGISAAKAFKELDQDLQSLTTARGGR